MLFEFNEIKLNVNSCSRLVASTWAVQHSITINLTSQSTLGALMWNKIGWDGDKKEIIETKEEV